MKYTLKFIIFSVFVLVGFSSLGQSKKTIFFYEIDDKAKIIIDDKLVYESEEVGYLGGVKIEVDITKYVVTGDEDITIEVVNTNCPDCTGGNPWGVSYEIIDGDEVMDYQYDNGEGDEDKRVAYSYTFYWNDL
ncbi:hypothetical protein N7E81_15175 [Reichenbachiella carrageenanivorans]|uniref:Uncharacterized protein n=1 Tax=Reichenbachiella carrageenanivorans TaxID=2979869 RepID=A0ABY6CXR2_9BACT|nr:hypothetical protein [Reichenbachiella carrageenanivorans]UXX78700.1 hypothetical protein N7E81_15175 [Reichenbachiella carrageenanivorans]